MCCRQHHLGRPHRLLLGRGRAGDRTRGRGLSDQQAYSKIIAHTRAAFGQPVNPHLFRDAATTTLALDRPEQVHLAAPLLGHRSFATTKRFYNLARVTEAAGAWHDVLATLAEGD
jgi:integrase